MKILKWLLVADRYYKIYLDKQLAPFEINSSQHMFLIKICNSPFAIPGITASLVGSVYNIVDKIFIGQGGGKRHNPDGDFRTCLSGNRRKPAATAHYGFYGLSAVGTAGVQGIKNTVGRLSISKDLH